MEGVGAVHCLAEQRNQRRGFKGSRYLLLVTNLSVSLGALEGGACVVCVAAPPPVDGSTCLASPVPHFRGSTTLHSLDMRILRGQGKSI